jgi:hypothetical protein
MQATPIGDSSDDIVKKLTEAAKIDLSTFNKSISDLSSGAQVINNTFLQSRQRISELMLAIADTTPGINRLGGSIAEVSDTINKIALASRRNVIASSEDVEKLYAASKLLDKNADTIVNSFADVGVGISEIGNQVENSINYVRSIGGNAKEVMGTVLENTEKLNRYQFEGGVAGLTKMAAQASMLRFDMGQTFTLAERVLDPDKAIDVASAFQRLGVSAGNLADPFQLMNQSINDPSGLQDSLVNVSKQFTYFDEKTKSFKINPQGVLTLKAMEDQTNVSAKEMMKMGVAAAELDKRVSSISPSIKFKEEDDRKLLANIASMKDGKYQVELEDGSKKELSELTQKQVDDLIEKQKSGPKTLEDIQRKQLNLTELVTSDVTAIKNKIVGGVTSARQVRGAVTGLYNVGENLSGSIEKNVPKTESTRQETESLLSTLGDFAKKLEKGEITGKTFEELSNKLVSQFDNIERKGKESIKSAISDISKNAGNNTEIERIFKKYIVEPTAKAAGIPSNPSKLVRDNTASIQNYLLPNSQKVQTTNTPASTQNNTTSNSSQQIDFGGTVTFKVDAPPGVSVQYLTDYLNSEKFKEMIYTYMQQKNKQFEKSK